MILEVISSKEFDRYALKHPQNNFYQSSNWGSLKEKNGWNKHFLALKENGKIVGATLLLEKKTFLGGIFYAPRGFLTDYSKAELVSAMTSELKKYIRQKKGILLKIDPYLKLIERDIDGNICEGANNEKVDQLLKELGYKKVLAEHESGGLQPNYLFVLDVFGKDEDQLLKKMDQQTRWSINKTLKLNFEIVEIDKKNIEHYKKIMEHTATRRGFIDRSLAYYQDMYNTLGDNIKILMARINLNDYLKRLNEQLHDNELLLVETQARLNEIPGSKKFNNQMKVVKETEISLNKKIEEAHDLKQKHGSHIDMAGAMFILYGDEVVYLFSGAYEEYMHFNAQYALQWHMIKYALHNGYKRYNFYGIGNNFTDQKDPMYGIYMFKRGFDGYVVELVGEYDYAISKIKYTLYKLGLKIYALSKR